jgi:serine/threonine-protein kinase
MAEELISHLSKVEGLQVAARTSAFQFKGRNPDVREVGEKLRVATVLEGSVRRSGDRLRITAQLVDAHSGYQLWSQTYERQLSDIFAIQDEISRAIVEALQVRLASGAAAPLAAPTQDIEAYEQYLKGLHFFNRHQIPQATEHLEEATRRDPEFARAYAALAEAYTVRYSDRPPPENHARGVAAARAALRLDPSLADAHAALGWLEVIDFRWAEAEPSLRRAIELDPRAPRARFYYAIYLHRQGRWDDAFAQMARARELDPLSLPINALYGSFLGDLGRVDEAVGHLKATLELDPSFPVTHAMLGHIYMGTGRTGEAIRQYERVAELLPVSMYAGFLGNGYARAGRSEDARRVLEQLKARAGRGEYVSPGAIGWIYLGLGERDEGFRWLERAAEERDVFVTVYGVLANRYLSAPYREDPRFQQIRRKIGLPAPAPSERVIGREKQKATVRKQ